MQHHKTNDLVNFTPPPLMARAIMPQNREPVRLDDVDKLAKRAF
jgi:hypothetical protein